MYSWRTRFLSICL